MDNATLINTPHWYAIHTHPRQELRAESNLRAWNVETFAPRIKDCRYYNGVLVQMAKPLFPRYIFARFKVEDLMHKVSFTRGVNCVVNFGGNPAPVDDQIIDLIKMRVGNDGFISWGETFEAGDVVRIKDGPLKNFMGVFERELKQKNRVMLLLTAINYQSHLEIERQLVQKVGA
jgi:transcriptional antiterminator RfaH